MDILSEKEKVFIIGFNEGRGKGRRKENSTAKKKRIRARKERGKGGQGENQVTPKRNHHLRPWEKRAPAVQRRGGSVFSCIIESLWLGKSVLAETRSLRSVVSHPVDQRREKEEKGRTSV